MDGKLNGTKITDLLADATMEKLKSGGGTDQRRLSVMSQKNDLVQNYLNTLDEALPLDSVDIETKPR